MTALLSSLGQMFSLSFMVYALITGVLVSLCAALLGVSLVLKRYSMIGDGLSHVAFGSLAVATALSLAPMKVAVPVVILSAFLLLRLSEKGKLKGDALTAMISTGALAVGYLAVSLSTGMNIDIDNYLFGSILTLTKSDVWLSVGLAALVIPAYILLFHRIFSVTFDHGFAKATGMRIGLYDSVFAILTALTIVLGMRFMGTLLISALIVFPPLTAMRVMKSFRGVVICSAVLPLISFVTGLILSCVFSTPPGASVVCVSILLFMGFALFGWLRRRGSR
ncbi:MAG: metal ABC transporter permease [Ruminococcaceae bacterium]|nr:metal ABC transporter permease [Oscillospiraceae bacterium]